MVLTLECGLGQMVALYSLKPSTFCPAAPQSQMKVANTLKRIKKRRFSKKIKRRVRIRNCIRNRKVLLEINRITA